MQNIIIGSFSLYQLFLYFFTYSFLGWCMEVAYATYRTNKFINRGFLNGPVCPIYGTGIIIVLLALTPLVAHPLLLCLCSILLTTGLELVTGFILERFFHTKWWDYSVQKWNFKGYICVKFSLFWGIACLLVVYVFHPLINGLLMKIPYTVGLVFVIIFGVIITVDLILTILQMVHFGKLQKEIKKACGALHKPSDKIGTAIYDVTSKNLEYAEKLKLKMEKLRLIKAYPALKQELVDVINKLKGENK